MELLYTLKAILPVSPEDWAQVDQIHNDNFPDTNQSIENLRRKYNGLYQKQIPTGDPNFPKDVKLAKRVKYLIKCKEGVGDGQEPYGMETGYQTNTEDKEYIASSGEEQEEDDNFGDDNVPQIPPLGQPSQTMTQQSTTQQSTTQQSTEPTQPTQQSTEPTQPTQQSTEPTQPIQQSTEPTQPTQPTQQSTEPTQPTQPTQPPLCQPSQPNQEEPELNTPTAINNSTPMTPINIPPRIVVPRSWSWSASSSSSSQWFPAARASPSPNSTLQSKRQYRRNANTSTTNNSTNGRQEILDFLIENSEREREQRIEYQRLEREQRIEYQRLKREQRQAALESLKAAIVDVATIFLNGLRPNSNPNSNSNPPQPGNPNNSNSAPPRPAPLKSLVVPV
eukprot:jgi/Psemu1/8045/gm1.8045_g